MPSLPQSEVRKKEYYVIRDAKTGYINKVVFPNNVQIGLDNDAFNGKIILTNSTVAPTDTKNALYAVNGNIYFNGVLIGAAGGANVTVKDEGSVLVTTLSSLNFTGAGVTATASGNDVTVAVNSVPGGSDTYVQFNDGGSTFGGDSGLTYDKTTDTLTVGGDLAVNGSTSADITTTTSAATIFNTNATTISIGGDATTLSIGNTATAVQTLNVGAASTGASTYNIGTGATASGRTKTLNIGTGGAAGSTTNVNLGSSTGGTITSNNNLVVNGSMYSTGIDENLVLAMQVFG